MARTSRQVRRSRKTSPQMPWESRAAAKPIKPAGPRNGDANWRRKPSQGKSREKGNQSGARPRRRENSGFLAETRRTIVLPAFPSPIIEYDVGQCYRPRYVKRKESLRGQLAELGAGDRRHRLRDHRARAWCADGI